MASRRLFLFTVTGLPLALRSSLFAAGNTGNNPTWQENKNAGNPNWQIGLAPYRRSDDYTNQLRGYASATSINKGDKITFYITVNLNPNTYDLDIYRVGWYGGAGGQLKLHVPGLTGVSQPHASYDSSTGMITCPWSPSYTLDTSKATLDSTGWTSGVYLALLTGAANFQTWIVFVIRDDARTADIMFQQSVTTYQAYNNYPADGSTGKSLYDGGSYGSVTALGTQRAVKVSFDRPYSYTDYTGAGELLHYDIYMIRWLERNGYDVCYSTDVDTHVNGARLKQFKAFLSVGHDEYWSQQMYNNAYAARDAGTSLGYFGANANYYQIRFEPSTINGVANRVITCYKDATLDPYNNSVNPLYNPSLTTVDWRGSLLNRPEQQLLGIMYSSYIDATQPAYPYRIENSQTTVGKLIYGGTGLTDGSSVPGVVGYEFDHQFPNYNTPLSNTDPASKTTVVPGTYTLLSNSPYTDIYGNADYSNSSLYQVTSGAWVFAAGTMYWNWGLDSYTPPSGIITYAAGAPSMALEATTANILNLFLGATVGSSLAAPSNLTAVPGVNSIKLTWQDNAPTATGITVQRSTDNATWVTLTSALAGTATTYTDNGITGTFYYRVQATDSAGHSSAYSNTVSAIASSLAAPSNLAATPAVNAIILTWQDNAPGGTAITVQRSPDNATWITLTSALAGTATTYTDNNISGSFYYRVQATDTAGHASAYSNVVFATAGSAASGPAAWWKMDEGSGATTADASGNGNAGTLINAAWATGSYGKAISLSGSNSYVSVAESSSIEMTTQLTVSFWMNPQVTSSADPRVIAKLYCWDVKLNGSNGFPQFSAGGKYAQMPGPAVLKTWQHIVFTFSTGIVTGYVNGALVVFAQNTFAGTETLLGYQYGLYIGTDPSVTASFTGTVDDVRLYNRALSAAEIQALYNSTLH